MSKEEIFMLLKNIVVEIMPDISPEQIKIEESLKDLGANSVDRIDIFIRAMEVLNVKIPLIEFGKLNNIQGLVDLLHTKKVS
jgi:polyketide biosynthesis acyl carrier protein